MQKPPRIDSAGSLFKGQDNDLAQFLVPKAVRPPSSDNKFKPYTFIPQIVPKTSIQSLVGMNRIDTGPNGLMSLPS